MSSHKPRPKPNCPTSCPPAAPQLDVTNTTEGLEDAAHGVPVLVRYDYRLQVGGKHALLGERAFHRMAGEHFQSSMRCYSNSYHLLWS